MLQCTMRNGVFIGSCVWYVEWNTTAQRQNALHSTFNNAVTSRIVEMENISQLVLKQAISLQYRKWKSSFFCSTAHTFFKVYSIIMWITYRAQRIPLHLRIRFERYRINSDECFNSERHQTLRCASWWDIREFRGIENLYLIINSKHNQE